MIGPSKLENIFEIKESSWNTGPGRVMLELKSSQADTEDCVLYDVIQRKGRDASLELLDHAGIRGRAGGGFPAGHKWWLVSSAQAAEKFFICNANFAEASKGKESWLILANPAKVVEAAAIAAYCVGAHRGYIALPDDAWDEIAALEDALSSAYQAGMLGKDVFCSGYQLDIELVKTPVAHLAGEETALMEFIEGRLLHPRKKPPLPTSAGLFGKPTAINNLETLLQCRYALKVGADAYRSVGTSQAPGTIIFSLRGCVNQPGIYELPLGTTLRELIVNSGGGVEAGTEVKGIFPGGISSPMLKCDALDTSLDFDSLRDAGSDLGSGVVVVIGEATCAVELATRLAGFFHEASCGKCRPCKDGTSRTHTMLSKIDQLDTPSVDLTDASLPVSKRPPQPQLTILNNQARGISYTDSAKGLEKISLLCEFFKYRGDCHHSTEAAASIMSLLNAFPEEFNEHMLYGTCKKTDIGASSPAMTVTGSQNVLP
jgi:NADH-quinone oxidoreductase subunit F